MTTDPRSAPNSAWGLHVQGHSEKVAFIWSVADLLRGDYKQSEYGKVILPLTVLRRLDCVLEPTKDAGPEAGGYDPGLSSPAMRETDAAHGRRASSFYNISPYTFQRLKADPDQIAANLRDYIAGFSSNVRDVSSTSFDFDTRSPGSTARTCSTWSSRSSPRSTCIPTGSRNLEMGYLFEELIRRFSELSNETAGEHFTPREVIRLMVNLLFVEDDGRPDPSRRDRARSTTRPAAPAACSRWPRSTSATSTPRRSSRSSGRNSTPRPTPSASPT